MAPETITETNLEGLSLFKRGKVRDMYEVGDRLLIVATDRISAFDCVLPTGIKHKGRVLTALTEFWLEHLGERDNSHLITTDMDEMGPDVARHAEVVKGRCMLVKRAEVVPLECVVRGYLAGSAWREYEERGEVCGIKLPSGLVESAALEEPIFTPATKAESGHDENVSEARAAELIGKELSETLRERIIDIYTRAAAYARERGILISDTKFEWGVVDGRLILIDEVLTPDSSRFWPTEEYEPGRSQFSFDKQYVRDYLEGLDWDKTPPAPPLPEAVADKTSEKYLQAYIWLTGHSAERITGNGG